MAKQANNAPAAALVMTTTQLPGMNYIQVIVSSPQLVRENSQYASKDKKK